jgi:uncharacterized circularly permuted ATP-grasp superfamily protein/uncharacterized alpha-E superfamily protein
VTSSQQSDPQHGAAAVAARLALPVAAGHRDELRTPDGELRTAWRTFFEHLGPGGYGDLPRRRATIERQIRDDGITYNVFSTDGSSARPWSLDLLPCLITADEWHQLETGLAQRAALLSAILRDVYGKRRLLAANLLPPALVLGHPGYLRPLVGHRPVGDGWLQIVAFDVARDPQGQWWVIGNRTQSPSGVGYALQNRLIISRLFPEAFRAMQVQRLAASYRRLLDTLQALSPQTDGEPVRLVLLTPGPYAETYFEHAYLARYLGIPLVEGSDLTVRDDCVFLKTLHGLQRVHGMLRRLDDEYCDPLELRQDSTLGVPGLLQAVRAGKVLVANGLGSAFLESPAINGFLPAIAQHETGQPLLLPSLASWWCGERAAYLQVADALGDKVIKPTYPASPQRPAFEPVIGSALDRARLRKLQQRIEADPDAHTVQAYLPLPQAPTWHDGTLMPRAAMVRVYAISDGAGGWHVMPGGLTRVAQQEELVVSMQRGGSSQDTWVQTDGTVSAFSMLPRPLRAEELVAQRRIVSSRAAENLFWMGRYTERADYTVRLARAALTLIGDVIRAPSPAIDALTLLCEEEGLVPSGTPAPKKSFNVFERTLVAGLMDEHASSVAHNLVQLLRTASHIRDRLSADHWRLISATAASYGGAYARAMGDGLMSADQAVATLGRLAEHLAAITGAQVDRMTRDDGWRLLTIGRQLERLNALARALHAMLSEGAVLRDDGFDLLLLLFDSTITYRSLHQRRLEMPPLIDLLVQEHANPRSLRGVTRRIIEQIERLGAPGAADLLQHLPALHEWPPLTALCEADADGRYTHLLALSARLADGSYELSDAIGARYFSHASDAFRTVRA